MSTTPGDGQPADQPPGQQSDDAAAREWWDDPGLPWKHKPTKADISCLVWMGIASVYGLILLPLRPVMLGLAPHLLGSLGYRTGLVMTRALEAPPVTVGGPGAGAGQPDGDEIRLDLLVGRQTVGPRADRGVVRTLREGAQTQPAGHRVHAEYETWAIFVTYLPIPMRPPWCTRHSVRRARSCRVSDPVSFISSVIKLGVVHVPGLADR
ncbi:MAG: hypothetical protein R2742_13220 [Micropruina glycogenica]